MKRSLIILSISIINISIYSSQQSGSLEAQMFVSSSLHENNQHGMTNLTKTVRTYPLLGVTPDNRLYQGIQNRKLKAMLPLQMLPCARATNISILHPAPNAFNSYPSGSDLFGEYSDIASSFDAMITLFRKNKNFITFFRKVHINVLNELYHYLMGMYVNFNLQHAGVYQNAQGGIQVSIPDFVNTENEFHINTKTLIINHLIDIIESQFNGAIRSYAKGMPASFATSVGKTAIQNDFSIDLSRLILHQIQPDLIAMKRTYMQALADYLSFFQLFTSYLDKPHPKTPQRYNAFVDIAEKINTFLYQGSSSTDNKDDIAFAKMNPPLFHFRYDDIRAIKLISYLAKTLPSTTKNVLWPDHIVQAAQMGYVLTPPGQQPHPIAYFKTKDNVVVSNIQKDPTIPLYVCMRLGDNLFEEKIIAQPDWLNSWAGIYKIMAACFGDFSQLVGMDILDPCMENLITNALLVQQGKDINTPNSVQPAFQEFFNQWHQFQNQTAQPSPSLSFNTTPSFNPNDPFASSMSPTLTL